MRARAPNILLLFGTAAGVLLCLWLIATQSLNGREASLLGVVLTIASMLGSWVTSRYYAEASFNENTRVFALKAAEKVDNLSNELDRLSVFLQQELEEEDYTSPTEELLAKELRIEAAIHVINTLKSVNDRSLSDWQGVIGPEIEEKREQKEEREEELRELLERVASLSERQPSLTDDDFLLLQPSLNRELEDIRANLRLLASQVGGLPVRRAKTERQMVVLPCPVCSSPVQFRQKPKPLSVKASRCKECDTKLYSRFENEAFILRKRVPESEKVSCPDCGTVNDIDLDPVPGSISSLVCKACHATSNVARTADGFVVRQKGKPSPMQAAPTFVLTEPILESVAKAMPPQPWPRGAARASADKLGLAPRVVSEAIQELVRRGRFKLQVEGKLYEVVKNAESESA